MVASSSAGFLSSMTARGRPLTKSTMSGAAFVLVFSVTVNWLTASQSLAVWILEVDDARLAHRGWSRRCDGYSTVTPFTSRRWKARLRASRVGPAGWVSLRKASSRAGTGELGVEVGEGIAQPLFQKPHGRSRSVQGLGASGAMSGPCMTVQPIVCQPVEGDLFDVGFGEGGHGKSHGLTTSTSRAAKSLTLRVARMRPCVAAVPTIRASGRWR